MLVLSRKLGEKICIGDQFAVTVMDISQGRVRLGITCPKDVPVHREEIYLRIQEEKNRSTNQGE